MSDSDAPARLSAGGWKGAPAARWITGVVFAGGFLATFLFGALVPRTAREQQRSDYTYYYQATATSLLEGRGYSTPTGWTQTRVPPGYPLLLAAAQWPLRLLGVGAEPATEILMALCMGLGAVAIFLIGLMVWNVPGAVLGAVVWTTFPFTQFLTIQFGSDVPFLPLLYGVAGLFLYCVLSGTVSPILFFLTGALAGGAMLIRPIAIGLGALLALLSWFAARGRPLRLRATLAAALLLGSLVVVLPWELWLYLKTGRVILLSDAGTSTLREGWMFGIHPEISPHRPPVDQGVSDLMRRFEDQKDGGSFRSILGVLAAETLRHPGAVARLVLIKATRCWYGTESFRFERVILLVQALYLPILIFAGWSAWRAGPAARRVVLCIALLILYFWGMAFLVVPLVRYLVPVEALALVLLPAPFRRLRGPVSPGAVGSSSGPGRACP